MNETNEELKPIPDQIIEGMVEDIQKHSEFNAELVSKINELYKLGGLKKSSSIIETIMPKEE